MFVFVLLFAAGLAYWELIPAYQSRHWPATPGQITHSHWERIESTGPKKTVTYKIEVAYSYTVDFNTYTNDRLAFGHDNPEDVLRDYLQSHPAGSAATVYYDPRDPAQSTLIPGPGLLDWGFAASAVFLLLLTLPLLRRRSVPPDELSLLARYRVHPHTTKDVVTLESVAAAAAADLPHWTTPPDEFEHARRQRRRTYLFAAARTLLILVIIEYAFYAYFSPRLPFLFDSSHFLWLLFLGMNIYALIPLAAMALPRGRPAEYRLTPDGIRISSHKHPLFRYRSLHSFTLSHDPEPPHVTTIHLHTKDGRTRSIRPPADLSPQVISIIAENLPEQPPLPRHRPTNARDWLLGLAVLAVYTAVVGLLIRHNRPYLHAHDAGSLIQLGILLFGPGTFTVPLLYRRRATGQLIAFAGMLNFLGMLTTMLYALLPRLLSALP